MTFHTDFVGFDIIETVYAVFFILTLPLLKCKFVSLFIEITLNVICIKAQLREI